MAAPKGNQFAVGNSGGGRPRKWNDPDEMYRIGTEYLDKCIENGDHLTFTGLCLSLGLVKESYNEYLSGKYDDAISGQVFSSLLKEMKQRVENYAEQRIFSNNPAGAIFALKNYGWRDRQELDVNADLDAQISVKFVPSTEED